VTHRFLLYPLVLLTVLQLLPLWRGAPRWFFSQILQHVVVLVLAGIGWTAADTKFWVGLAWAAFLLVAVVPRWAMGRAVRQLRAGHLPAAARGWRWVGLLIGGHHGALLRRQAGVWEREAGPAVPELIRGEVRLWHLWACLARQEWERASTAYEGADGWGTLGCAMQARLAAAPAYAATGRIGTALRCLLFVAASPRTVGPVEQQWWRERCRVAVAAGDREELEQLLAGHRATRETEQWREQCVNTPRPVVLTDDYRQMRALLRHAAAQMAPWRALMGWRRLAPVTAGMLGVLAVVFLVDVIGWRWLADDYLWNEFGNVPGALAAGEWWRPLTALGLHANALHLALNALALWIFGTALERAWGAGRMVAIFLGAGVAGNLASAWLSQFEVSVGASSGLFGLVSAFGVALYRWRSPVTTGMRRRLLLALALMVGVDATIGFLEPQIDNLAHLAGGGAGLLLAWGLTPKSWTHPPSVPIVART
jgi:membrane associated rhomboid family serine protease